MAHLLYDYKYLFEGVAPLEPRTYLEGNTILPSEIYELTIDGDIR